MIFDALPHTHILKNIPVMENVPFIQTKNLHIYPMSHLKTYKVLLAAWNNTHTVSHMCLQTNNNFEIKFLVWR